MERKRNLYKTEKHLSVPNGKHPRHEPAGTEPATQACGLNGNRTSSLLVSGMMANQLSILVRALYMT